MTESHAVTIVGLGPGDVAHLTLEAFDLLQVVDRIFVRTRRHPTVEALAARLPQLEICSYDDLYESRPSFDEVYATIAADLLKRAREGGVIYCVPGSPSLDETTVQLVTRLAAAERIPIRIVHGMSYLEAVLSAAGHGDRSWLTVVDAIELDVIGSENALGEVRGVPGLRPVRLPVPTVPLVISQVYDSDLASAVKLFLGHYWGDEHEVIVIRSAGMIEQSMATVPVHQLDRQTFDHLTTVYVPPLDAVDDVRSFTGLLNVTRSLRAPGGCPWDREQTHGSLKPHLLEEAYEVIEALDQGDPEKLAGELGDLLFQITIHSQVAAEAGEFDISDVIAAITEKLVRRHPHVFADLELATSTAVLERWESFKQAESPERPSILTGIPLATPALPYSTVVQKRAANQGFEWSDIASVLDKVREELGELESSVTKDESRDRVVEELGDLFFALVSVGRWLKIDPEEALRQANRKFVGRFQYVEQAAKATDRPLRDLSPAELDELWGEAKGTLPEE